MSAVEIRIASQPPPTMESRKMGRDVLTKVLASCEIRNGRNEGISAHTSDLSLRLAKAVTNPPPQTPPPIPLFNPPRVCTHTAPSEE